MTGKMDLLRCIHRAGVFYAETAGDGRDYGYGDALVVTQGNGQGCGQGLGDITGDGSGLAGLQTCYGDGWGDGYLDYDSRYYGHNGDGLGSGYGDRKGGRG